MIYNDITETIGNTPVVRINNIGPKDQNIFVKCEAFNPLASVKDRLALAIINDAEKSGKLKPGQTVIEATSGNTGIALAMVCAARGYPFVAVMVEMWWRMAEGVGGWPRYNLSIMASSPSSDPS